MPPLNFYVKEIDKFVKGHHAMIALRKVIRVIIKNAKVKNIDIFTILNQHIELIDENQKEYHYIISILPKQHTDKITSIYTNLNYKIEIYKKQADIF